jgi:hypothetical protein
MTSYSYEKCEKCGGMRGVIHETPEPPREKPITFHIPEPRECEKHKQQEQPR